MLVDIMDKEFTIKFNNPRFNNEEILRMIYGERLLTRQEKLNPNNIDKVIFNPPATIVIFKDGTKEVVKCSKDDEYIPEVGFAQAMMNIMFGNRSSFKRFIKKYEEE